MPDKYDQINSDIKSIRDARVCLLGILFSWSKENNKSFGEAQAGTNIGMLVVDLSRHFSSLMILARINASYEQEITDNKAYNRSETLFLLNKVKKFKDGSLTISPLT